MGTRATHTAAVEAAIRAKDVDGAWQAYTGAWGEGVSPPMSAKTFDELFYDGNRARAAVELAAESQPARLTLRPAAMAAPHRLHDGDVLSVACAVLQPEELVQGWASARGGQRADDRTQLARNVVRALTRWMGREWTRDHVLSWWAAGDLLEEEREAILDALGEDGVLTETLTQSLGPLAQRRGRGRTIAPGFPLRIAPSTPELETAIGSLLSLIRLPSDLRDASFSPEERDRCQATSAGWSASFLQRSLEELRHHSPFWDEFAHTVEKAWRHGLPLPLFALPGSQSEQDGNVFGVPLVRLLHMRLVLEAPALAGALASPHDHLTPAALLHVLGQDAVTYHPEVRVHQGVERRWRARWVEMSGEALAALVLEDALRLDLTTLARIPERSDRETPDFMAATRGGEEIVFESKGSTHLATHRRQRRKALAQLGKVSDGEGSQRSRRRETRARRIISWKEPGRAFACCFFAAMQGARASSRIHVADPAFGFRDLFHEGWATAARRTHYGAVAEAAGLFDLADDLLQQRRGERPLRGDIESFSFGVGNNQVGRFRGTSTSLGDAARRLRHPRYRLFERARMFVGIAEDRFELLTHDKLPGCLDLEATPLVGSGALPAREGTSAPRASSARGVYSLLCDGSFLAFEVD